MAHSWPVQASLGFAALLLFQPFSPRNVFAVRAAPSFAASSSVAPAMGSVCRFTSGPKAGTTRDFAPMLAAVGSPCSDGAGSRGKVERSGKPAALATTPVSQQMGTVCAFTAGPKAGTSHDYAPMKAPLGMDCSDGAGSHGIIVLTAPAAAVPAVQTLASESAAAPGGQSPQTGTVCKFTSGPKAGTERDYAPMHAPLNTACDDGAGSSGVIVAAVQTGSVCKFTSGPKAGTEQDYAPMHAPLNTVCEDGAGSSGVIVKAPQMGSVCKFTAGPKAGTEHDYAPMHEPVNTTCDDGAGSSGVIVAAQQEGTICRFNAGPRAGSQQDYAPVHAPLNTACSDGAGSSGIIVAAAAAPASPAAMAAAAQPPAASAPGTHPVSSGSPSGAAAPTPASAGGSSPAADTAANASGLQEPAAAPHSRVQLGSVCKITSGPKAGSTYDFAPMRADVGALCNYGPDNTGVIIASPSKPAKTGPPRVYSVP